MRLNRALAVLVFATAGSSLTTVPAQAHDPVLSFWDDLDTSQPGHVKGTIFTDEGAFVHARLSSAVPATTFAVTDGQAAFDLETWGYFDADDPNLQVEAVACTGGSLAAPTGCGATPVLSPAFTPNDLAPTVTWPEDSTIGHTEDRAPQLARVTVSDPGGGGDLNIAWHYSDPAGGDDVQVFLAPHDGTLDLDLRDGVGVLRLARCASANAYICTYYTADESPPVTVAQGPLQADISSATPITALRPDSTVTVTTNHFGEYHLFWYLLRNGYPVNPRGTITQGMVSAEGTLEFTIPGAGLTGSGYEILGQLSINDPEFGPSTSPLATRELTVDRIGPFIEGLTVSRATFYPKAIDALAAYRTVAISVTDDDQLDDGNELVVLNGAGTVVRHLETTFGSGVLGRATWDGRNDAGVTVRPDAYLIAVVDELGNLSRITRGVVLLHDRGTLYTYRKTVSAEASRIHTYVGRCSTFRRPSLRGWTGSAGYYSNNRCRGSVRSSTVSTLNAIRLPRTNAVRFVDTRVDTYGGAARRAPGSHGLIRLRVGDRWTSFASMGRAVGTHTGPRRAGAVDRERDVQWNFRTTRGNRYDVKSFTVTVRYYRWK